MPTTNLLTDLQYGRAVRLIRGFKVWRDIQRDYLDLYYRYLGKDERDELAVPAYERLAGRFQRLAPLLRISEEDLEHELEIERQRRDGQYVAEDDPEAELEGEARSAKELLSDHAAICMLDDMQHTSIIRDILYPEDVPLSYLLSRSDGGAAHHMLDANGLTPEAFLAALRLYSTAINPSYRVSGTLRELYEYDIPFSGSPKGFFRKLREILREDWNTLVAIKVIDETNKQLDPMFPTMSDVDGNLVIQTPDPTVISPLTWETRRMDKDESGAGEGTGAA